MINFKSKVSNAVKNSAETIKHQAVNLNKTIVEGSEDLNRKIQDGSESLNKTIKNPPEYNFLVFAFPILLILIAFVPMAPWVAQVIGFVIFCCLGYVLFYEYRQSKKYDRVFFIALGLVILFNPIIPFYIPGLLINIIAIGAIGYLAFLTKIDNSTGTRKNMKPAVKATVRNNSGHANHSKKSHK